jgi:cell division protein FtsI/penicillin-binding protein 2
MSSHGDDIEVTAIQLARMASAIGNGGKLLVPHLPRTPQENVSFKREVKRDIEIPEDNLRRMLPGMIGAVSYGTAKRAAAPTFTVAGKTGTCTGQGSKLGLFTSYGPVSDPNLAVAVILRNSGAGGKWAAAVAGDVYRRLAEDAFVMSESGKDASGTGAQRPALQKTAKTGERPVATPPPAAPSPNTNAAAPATNGAQRPRRVSDRPE